MANKVAPFVGVSPEDLGPLADLTSIFNIKAFFEIVVEEKEDGVERDPSRVIFYLQATPKTRGKKALSAEALVKTLKNLFSLAGFEELSHKLSSAKFSEKENLAHKLISPSRKFASYSSEFRGDVLINQEMFLKGNDRETKRIKSFILEWLDKEREAYVDGEIFFKVDFEDFERLIEGAFSWIRKEPSALGNEWSVNPVPGAGASHQTSLEFGSIVNDAISEKEREVLLETAKDAVEAVSGKEVEDINKMFTLSGGSTRTWVYFVIYAFSIVFGNSEIRMRKKNRKIRHKKSWPLVATIEIDVSSLRPNIFSSVVKSDSRTDLYKIDDLSENSFRWLENIEQTFPPIFFYRKDLLKLESASVREIREEGTSGQKSNPRKAVFVFHGGGRQVETFFAEDGERVSINRRGEGDLLAVPEVEGSVGDFVDRVHYLVDSALLGPGARSLGVPSPDLPFDRDTLLLENLYTSLSPCLGVSPMRGGTRVDLAELLGLLENRSVINRAIQRLLKLDFDRPPGNQGLESTLFGEEELCRFIDSLVVLGAKLYSSYPESSYEDNTSLPVLALSVLRSGGAINPNRLLQLYITRTSLCKVLRFMLLYSSSFVKEDHLSNNKRLMELFSSHREYVTLDDAVVSISHKPERGSVSQSAYDKVLGLSLLLEKRANFVIQASFSLLRESSRKGARIDIAQIGEAHLRVQKAVSVNTFIA